MLCSQCGLTKRGRPKPKNIFRLYHCSLRFDLGGMCNKDATHFPSGENFMQKTSAEFSLMVSPGWSLAPKTLSMTLSSTLDSPCSCGDLDAGTNPHKRVGVVSKGKSDRNVNGSDVRGLPTGAFCVHKLSCCLIRYSQ